MSSEKRALLLVERRRHRLISGNRHSPSPQIGTPVPSFVGPPNLQAGADTEPAVPELGGADSLNQHCHVTAGPAQQSAISHCQRGWTERAKSAPSRPAEIGALVAPVDCGGRQWRAPVTNEALPL